jgi:hypothetical protein
MTDDEQREDPNAELLPPREVMSLLNTDPSAYAGLLGSDPTAAGVPDTSGAADTAGSTAGAAQHLVDGQTSSSGDPTVSDQPQTVPLDSTETASSST